MDNTREKLIELLINSPGLETLFGDKEEFAKNADWLIANGVTVQKWIPVSERLPESGEYVMVYDTRDGWIGLWEFSGVAWYDNSCQAWGIDEVTHWMPLPEAPKGE